MRRSSAELLDCGSFACWIQEESQQEDQLSIDDANKKRKAGEECDRHGVVVVVGGGGGIVLLNRERERRNLERARRKGEGEGGRERMKTTLRMPLDGIDGWRNEPAPSLPLSLKYTETKSQLLFRSC